LREAELLALLVPPIACLASSAWAIFYFTCCYASKVKTRWNAKQFAFHPTERCWRLWLCFTTQDILHQ